MAKRTVLLIDQPESPWKEFLEEFFEDTPTALQAVHDARDAKPYLERHPADLVFAHPALVNLPLAQKLKALRQSSRELRMFLVAGMPPALKDIPFDGVFEKVPPISHFQKELMRSLPFPDTLRILIADDEPEIGSMTQDYLAHRRGPAFEVECVANGEKALESIRRKRPDVLLLDLKMPVKTGQEVYREIQEQQMNIPVIVFFDAISGDEVTEIHQYGRPAIVDKGSERSSMPEMMALFLKMAYFG